MRLYRKLTSLALLVLLLAGCVLPAVSCKGDQGGENDTAGAGETLNTNGSEDTAVETTADTGTPEKIEVPVYHVTKPLADFRYGTALPYDKYTKPASEGWTSWLSRTFEGEHPAYSYKTAGKRAEIAYKSSCVWSDPASDDDCNYYVIYPDASGETSGTVSARLRFYIPPLSPAGSQLTLMGYPADYTNYTDLSEFDMMDFVFSCESSKGRDVSFTVFLKDADSEEYPVYTYTGKGGKQLIRVDLSQYDKSSRDRMEYIRVENNVTGMAADETITCKWHYLQAGTDNYFNTKTDTVYGLTFESKYLSNPFYTMCGAYSATGFYDEDDGLWKMWYGAGVPEEQSTDNVYYTESKYPDRGWSKPVRITTDDSTGYKLIDESGKLRGSSSPVGYGGDPSVVKVDGVYYMYFSAIEWDLDDGRFQHWNKIWLATSTDAKTWTCVGAVVDPQTGGAGGYGDGSPSVVYAGGKFRMYYYAQAPDKNYPGEATGLCLKISEDGIHFGEAISINTRIGAMEVKYVPDLMKWIGIYYTEENQPVTGSHVGIRLAASDDGIHWQFDYTDKSMIAQDRALPINHNPGLLGTAHGWAGTTVYATWGANDLPLVVNGIQFSSAQYDARQMEMAVLTIR